MQWRIGMSWFVVTLTLALLTVTTITTTVEAAPKPFLWGRSHPTAPKYPTIHPYPRPVPVVHSGGPGFPHHTHHGPRHPFAPHSPVRSSTHHIHGFHGPLPLTG